jgi:hypothetical protein
MKGKLLILFTVICLSFTNFTTAMAKTVNSENVTSIKADVQSCNITFEKSTSSSFELNYYGDASSLNYDFKTSIKESVLKIDLVYTGSGMAPTIKEGGVIVKVPDKGFLSLDINGTRGAGITLNDINIDTNLKTENCAVIMTNDKAENKITIDSKYDSYEIKSAPPTKDFTIKANGCSVDFMLNKVPDNLHLKLTDRNGYISIPKTWSYDFSIGSAKPVMAIDTVDSVLKLHY